MQIFEYSVGSKRQRSSFVISRLDGLAGCIGNDRIFARKRWQTAFGKTDHAHGCEAKISRTPYSANVNSRVAEAAHWNTRGDNHVLDNFQCIVTGERATSCIGRQHIKTIVQDNVTYAARLEQPLVEESLQHRPERGNR